MACLVKRQLPNVAHEPLITNSRGRAGTEGPERTQHDPQRFQRDGSCDLAAVSSLPRNWTPGDYVSAVAVDGNPAQIREAAHSDCGKADGRDRPRRRAAHAFEHMAAGQAHAGGKAYHPGSGASGS